MLWGGPATAILIAESAAMVFTVLVLTRIVYLRSSLRVNEPVITGGDQFRKALGQMLPLAAFPIAFFVFSIPVLVYDIYYCFLTPTPDEGLIVTGYLFISLWTISSGVAVIVHIFVAQLPARCKKLHLRHRIVRTSVSNYHTMDPTVGEETGLSLNSSTSFRLPDSSIATSLDVIGV